MQIAAIDGTDMETFSDEESPQTRSSQDITILKILGESEQSSFSTLSEDPSKNDTTCAYNPPHVSLPPHSDDKISPSKVSGEARHTKRENPQLSTPLDDTPICIDGEITSESSKSYDGNWRGGGGGKGRVGRRGDGNSVGKGKRSTEEEGTEMWWGRGREAHFGGGGGLVGRGTEIGEEEECGKEKGWIGAIPV